MTSAHTSWDCPDGGPNDAAARPRLGEDSAGSSAGGWAWRAPAMSQARWCSSHEVIALPPGEGRGEEVLAGSPRCW